VGDRRHVFPQVGDDLAAVAARELPGVEQLAELSLRHGITTTLSPLFHSDANHQGIARVMDAVELARARGAAVWPPGPDPSHRHQLHARPAQPHAADHAVLVEGGLDQ
jgi:hypothetical protein